MTSVHTANGGNVIPLSVLPYAAVGPLMGSNPVPLERITLRREDLSGLAQVLLDGHMDLANDDPSSVPEAPWRSLMRDILAAGRREFSGAEQICADCELLDALFFVSREEEDGEEDEET
ncbi:hypothetical protein [Acidisoma cladoniae]|jgi:hypothetical protein|uniref:hypothetical protein n=1 Tax=Acidisoma cladoniae TaxID=3040935 RepID=UPI00254CA74E|nr:hypothetical protein [Acidisoma sp. PAMC 29798]